MSYIINLDCPNADLLQDVARCLGGWQQLAEWGGRLCFSKSSYFSHFLIKGEVDIVEGVNDHVPNQSTLHTGPGCYYSREDTDRAMLTFLCFASRMHHAIYEYSNRVSASSQVILSLAPNSASSAGPP